MSTLYFHLLSCTKLLTHFEKNGHLIFTYCGVPGYGEIFPHLFQDISHVHF